MTLKWGISSAARVTISVVDESGRTVRTLLAGQQRAGNATVRWDGRDGRGAIAPEGAYTLRLVAQAPGLPPLQRGVGVTLDQVSQHGTLHVQTTAAGRSAAGVTVIAYKSDGGAYVAQTTTDGSGAATLSLSAGRYDLLALAAGGAAASVHNMVVTRRGTQQRAIALTVPGSGSPVGTQITQTPAVQHTATPTATPVRAAQRPSGTPVPTTTVSPVATRSQASGQGTLTLTVVLAPGKPAAHADVKVLRDGKIVTSANADIEGKAAVSLASGTYTVQAALEAAEGSITVRVSGGAATASVLDLQAGTLQLVVRQPNGHPASYTPVYMLQGTKSIYDTGTNSEGQASAILPAGTYTIQAGTAPHDGTAPARLAAGATLTVMVKLH